MTDKPPFEALMHEVCVEKGWCGSTVNDQPLHVTDFFPERGEVTVDQFVAWIFEAEGVDPTKDRAKWEHHILGLREAFVRHMGGPAVDVQQLTWDGC